MVVTVWKRHLAVLLEHYESRSRLDPAFRIKLFTFFVALNFVCYWGAMFTAFPELCRGWLGEKYLKISAPVSLLGALFDSLSFFVTLWIVRRALAIRSATGYILHLGIDFVIAILATIWVFYVFVFSGWLINLMENPVMTDLAARNDKYERMVTDALADPTGSENLKNLYFGLVMGLSAMVPTLVHVSLFFRSIFESLRFRA